MAADSTPLVYLGNGKRSHAMATPWRGRTLCGRPTSGVVTQDAGTGDPGCRRCYAIQRGL